jgi:DNA-nicking Smr family endonuclease
MACAAKRRVKGVNFGEILEKWEKRMPTGAFYDKDAADLSEALRLPYRCGETVAGRRSRLIRKMPDATLDLHGLSSAEAWKALQVFFEDSNWKRLEKVLIIHGKGNHHADFPSGEGVLRELTRRFIESCSYAGESGFTNSRGGGRGATWVLLKDKSRENV